MTTSNKYFLFSGFGNYSETHNWDNGISMKFEKELSLEEVQELQYDEYGDFFNVPKLGEIVATFYNEYGGSRNGNWLICANSLEEAQTITKVCEDSYVIEEILESGYDVCQDPNGICHVFDSGGSYMGTRYSYMTFFESCEDAHNYCDEKNKERKESFERWS